MFQCEHCVFAKQFRSYYPSHAYKPSKPFHLIHSDIWGTSRTSNLNGTHWFITFIDDHTRVCWVYLMKNKSEAFNWFKQFHKFVLNVFQSTIQVLRTDNGQEYFSREFCQYLGDNGIHHQSSCVNTPKQNGVAERKNRHLLEVARSLMFTSSVLNTYWGEAILTSAYLINRLPSKTLQFRTPLNLLVDYFPTANLFNSLSPKVFGCSAYVHSTQPNRSKLDPKALKCVFVGYSPTQKRYKCYSPLLKRCFVSCDVTFFENRMFYSKEGKHLDENEHWDATVSFPISDDVSTLPTQSTHTKPVHEHDSTPHVHVNFSPVPILDPSLSSQVQNHGDKSGSMKPPLQTYCRRPKAPQHDQSLNQEAVSAKNNDLELPIAMRKGVRSCTKHPISNFLTCTKLSSSFKAFTAKIDDVKVPKNIHEALTDPKWNEAGRNESLA